jgi:hypothetical protein
MGKRVVDRELRRQRPALIVGIVVSFPVAVALWLCVYYGLPPLAGMADPLARLIVALGCCCIAIMLCFLTAIEAVSHERLRSPAIDPLSGYTTRRMTINLRYLHNTLEQLLLFIPGLLMLAYYCSNGSGMRAVVATTAVWIIARGAFWIGYHYGSQYRAIGAPGMMQSILVLLYVCGRFGFDVAGIAGAAAPLVLFFCIEAYLFYATRSRRPPI